MMLSVLADIVVRGFAPTGFEEECELRQLGYSAFVARGRVDDPQDNLRQVVKYCRNHLASKPAPEGTYRDQFQRVWGAEWHLDAGKVKVELPLHVLKLQRQMGADEV